MEGTIDIIKNAFSDAWKMWKKSGKDFFVDLLKISLLQWAIYGIVTIILVSAALILMGGAVEGATGMETLSLLTGNIAFVALAVLLVVASWLVASVLGSVVFNVVDNRANGKKTEIVKRFKTNFIPVTGYIALVIVISIIICLPIVLGYLFTSGASVLSILGGMCLFGFVSVVFYLLFAFLIQFSMLELVIERRGVVESLKSSYALVKKNIVTVLLFDIVYIIIAFGIGSITSVIERVFIVGIELMAFGGSIVGAAMGGVLYLLVVFLLTVASYFILLPIYYFLWRGLGPKKKQEEKKKTKRKPF